MGMIYGPWTALAVTALQSLAIDTADPFVGWQGARVDNITVVRATDFEVQILLSTAATAPANDKTVYVYGVPWINDGNAPPGSGTWTPAGNFSTTTRPTGSEGAGTMSEPNSMKGPIALPYIVASQPIDGFFTIAQLMGIVPDGWSLAIRNNCGAALGTGCVIAYRAVFQ
jgi:hypothetical protein